MRIGDGQKRPGRDWRGGAGSRRAVRALLAAAVLGILFLRGAAAQGPPVPPPGPKEKCPVCGMFVAKFPDFLSAAVFADGSRLWFDGAKDLFRFLHDPGRYDPRRKREDVARVLVKEYYDLSLVDGKRAFYVSGSNVFGPMGNELIPFRTEAEAREFMVDHAGKFLYRFDEVTPLVLQGLD